MDHSRGITSSTLGNIDTIHQGHIHNHSRNIAGNSFGDNATIHQGDIHHHSSNDETREDEDAKCLADLRTTDPRDDKSRIEATKGGLLKDSYRWILEHSDFRQWRDDERSRLLWIKGDPGKGKTMLLCGIVNELSSSTRLEDQEADTLLSYFFCQAADSRINSATAVLRGLIYLLVEQQPLLVSHIQKKYKHGGETLFKDVNAWTALSDIFSSILKDAILERVYVIIDALDECVTDLPKLLDFINTKSSLFPRVRWIVSSRNWPDIEERLDSIAQQTRLCLELNEKSISAAVSVYIEHQVEQLAQKSKYDAGIKDAVQNYLSTNANDTFLWVALVCQNLEKISLRNILLRLNEFPPGLDSLYKRMMEQIQQLENVNDTSFCCRILATVLLVYRPVTVAELGSLLESSDNNNPADAELIQKAIGLCGSFLTVRDSQVYFIHQSAKDFLSGEATSTIFPLGSANVHSVIFSRSLQAMSAVLRRNIYNAYPPGIPINEIKALDPDPLETIRYSCVHWVDHFCDMHNGRSQSQHQVDRNGQAVFQFLQKYFLYWLEALGLMGGMKDGILGMGKLDNLLTEKSMDDQSRETAQDTRRLRHVRLRLTDWLRRKSPNHQSPNHQSPNHQSPNHQSPDSQLLEIVHDSRRFIRQNGSVIADNPLQVYTSALIFSPSNSIIRKIFREEEPQWLTMKPTVESNWSPHLQTLEGHSNYVYSVAFSPDSLYLASASMDSTVRIWDATLGKEQQIFLGHRSPVSSVAFSVDGRYVASGSSDKTIIIWDVTLGKERQTLEGHSDSVRSVAFSPDGLYLASGSHDGVIKIWDATTGKERYTLKGHENWVQAVAFSPDSRYLASGSSDKTIKIWDAATGKERQTLKGHNRTVSSVAFSPDGRRLASASTDTTIKVWDVTAGKERYTLKGHENWVQAVAFSPDSRYLASGSNDNTVKIWDAATGKERQTLKGSRGVVQSIAFSTDGRYLASGLDINIQIWDAKKSKEQQIFEDHGASISSLTFTADGRYLAAELDGDIIKIWDATTGTELQTIDRCTDLIDSIVSSTDGRYVALAFPSVIKICDITRGKERPTLVKRHRSIVTSVAFSTDGRYLATGSDEISIWDIATGKERQIFGRDNSHYWFIGDKTFSVAFSPDGRYLASNSGLNIEIWDITTGQKRQTLVIRTSMHTISFDDTGSFLYTQMGPLKLSIKDGGEAQYTVVAQVLSPDSDLAEGQAQCQHVTSNAQKAKLRGYGLSTDRCWITWNGQNILWLGPGYQNGKSVVWSHVSPPMSPQIPSTDAIIALGTSSRRVVIFRMSGLGPNSPL